MKIYPWWPGHAGWFSYGDFIDVAIDYAMQIGDGYNGSDFEPLVKLTDTDLEFQDRDGDGIEDLIITKLWVESKSEVDITAVMSMVAYNNESASYSYGKTVAIRRGTNYYEGYFDADFIDTVKNDCYIGIGLYLLQTQRFILEYYGPYNASDFEELTGIPTSLNMTLDYEYTYRPPGALVFANINSSRSFGAVIRAEVYGLFENGSIAEDLLLDQEFMPIKVGDNQIKVILFRFC